MNTLIDSAERTKAAADMFIDPQIPFDNLAAQLVVENLMVAAYLLKGPGFSQLPRETADVVLDAVSASKDALSGSEEELDVPERVAGGSNYRAAICLPIHSLVEKLSSDTLKKDDEAEMAKVRTAVRLAGTAFAGIIKATKDNPDILSKGNAFHENVTSAEQNMKYAIEHPHRASMG